MNNEKCNIAIFGKTGVGKSSLINYLYGSEVAEAGTGKPVTGEGFYEYEIQVNKLPCSIIDTYGIEAGHENVKKWENLLSNELNKRGINKPISEWFHAIFFCIQGSGHRVEEFEGKVITQFIKNRYPLVVIITKSDLMSKDEYNKLEDAIKMTIEEEVNKSNFSDEYNLNKNELIKLSKTINIIPICSEGKILISGQETKSFGKEKVFTSIIDKFIQSIKLRLPVRCIEVIYQDIDNWAIETEKKYHSLLDKKEKSYDELINELKIDSQNYGEKLTNNRIVDIINEEINKSLSVYKIVGEFLTANHIKPRTVINNVADYLKMTRKSPEPDDLAGKIFVYGFAGIAITLAIPFFLLALPALLIWGKTDKENISKLIEKVREEIKNKVKNQSKSMEEQITEILGKILGNNQ